MINRIPVRLPSVFSAFVLFLFLVLNNPLHASEREELRAWAGINLFVSFLVANQDISTKKNIDGKLTLILVYNDNEKLSEEMRRHLEKVRSIRGTPIEIITTNYDSINSFGDTPIAGIFLTQPLEEDIRSLIQFGIEKRVIVFSPFEGDVEIGVPAGIVVSSIILPYINLNTIKESKINIKENFLEIAETYE